MMKINDDNKYNNDNNNKYNDYKMIIKGVYLIIFKNN
jgi:hypothetical protein